jgi:hypothetical protein
MISRFNRWCNTAPEWQVIGSVLAFLALLIAGFAWLLYRDHEKQCAEKGTYTVCTRERFSHMVKIGDTYHAQYVCLEHAEEPCDG